MTLDGRSVGAATQAAAVAIATGADRNEEAGMLPDNITHQMEIEEENQAVGLRATKWLRRRLPVQRRGKIYVAVLRQLGLQIRDDARHLRQLHMAKAAAELMGVAPGDEMGDLPDEVEENEAAEVLAKEIVDDMLMWVSNGMKDQRNTWSSWDVQGHRPVWVP